MKPNPHPIPSSVRKKFADLFNRADTENDLGITADGSRWDAIRGVFKISSNRAVSDSDPSSYPMATVNMPIQDVEISLTDIDSGAGAALWVTDSGEWWSVGLQQEEVDCNCTLNSECNRWNARNCAQWNGQECFQWGCKTWSGSFSTGCATWSAANCRFWNSGTFVGSFFVPGNCSSFNQSICTSLNWSANNCTSFVCNAANASNCRTFNTQTCNRWFEFTTDCETCYPQYVRVLQSLGSTISTVFSAIVTKTFETFSSPGGLTLYSQTDFAAPNANSMKVATDQDSLSVEVFSDTDLQNKIVLDEEITYGPTGAVIPTTYGIIINPSSYNQNNFIGEIDIDKT